MVIFFLLPYSLLLPSLLLTSRLAMEKYPRLVWILHFLPTFCLSVTKSMLKNDGPDFDEVNHFEILDNTTMCLSTGRTCSQVFDLVLIHALSHFMKFTFPGVTVQTLLALPATV